MTRGLALVVACALTLTACQQTDSGSPSPSPDPVESATAAPDLGPAARRVVHDRVAAIRSGDRAAFLATVDSANHEFSDTQARYFDNLQKLPLKKYSLAVQPGDLPITIRLRGDVQLVVRLSMQLKGYDEQPVVQEVLFTFVRGAHGRAVLTDDRDVAYDAQHHWLPAPWDVTTITVRGNGRVLGIFDRETDDNADAVMSELTDALDAVDAVVPPWRQKVVAYDISDLTALDRMSAMDVDHTSGVAFSVLGGPEGTDRVAMRFAVNPNLVLSEVERGLTFRHELTHVALADLDRGNPTWLVEGLAEYVSYEAFAGPNLDTFLADVSGKVGDVNELQPGIRFYERDPADNYRMSLLVTEWIAADHGRDALWALARAMDKATIYNQDDVDRVLRRELGVDGAELLAAAREWAATL